MADGGGVNHRAGLYDAILIKENHSAAAGGVGEAVRRARAARPDLPLAVEVRDAAEIDAALAAGAPRLLLDNMTPDEVRAAVAQVGGRAQLEASGGSRRPRQFWSMRPLRGYTTSRWARSPIQRPGSTSRWPWRPSPPMTLLSLDNIPALQSEVRALAAERGAVILAHNYQLPEVQDVADFVGDSLGLAQQAAKTDAEVIAFCGVHFMAETASILSPDKTVLLPDPDAGCSLADSITAPQLRAWKAQHPGAITVMYVNTTAEVKAETDYCVTSANAVAGGRAHLPRARRGHRDPVRARHVPRRLRREDDRAADARVGRRVPRPRRHPARRHPRHARSHPDADFLIHPECGCSTSVMEYVAAGDVDPDGVHMLSTGGMLEYARNATPARPRSWRPRSGCCTRSRWRPPTSTSWPPTRPPAAAS